MASFHASGPHTALAAVIEDGSISAVPQVSDATSAHVEAGFVVWVGVQAVGLAVAEARSWGVGGGSGGGGWGSGGCTRFRSGGGGQRGQLWMREGGRRNICYLTGLQA